ncbi:hypothetical protein QYE76_070413 [Lolium multiflorum]|uniref:Transposase (putative) gypsy type domain-containing protein n=1 Tax=Lolium multiflorum TaxID=4521 RepID=A0AAD8WDW3_LOLMU|nr:hypothetical protein QYE76_070413 [Lolium multiflorum]
MAAEDLEWERSKISNQDMNLLKRMGFTKRKDALRFPREESYPKPPMEYRVSFVDHLIRGLSPPIHEFLRGLLFVYGLQLHQLTPNSILHVSIFITLCECFLGVQPNWALWKRIFCLRRNGSHGVAYNIGGVVICVRSDVDYFDVKFPDSVQGWRKRWLYVHEESSDSMEYNIAPFDGKAKILRRRSWDAEASEEEKLATEALMTRIRELQTTRGKELSELVRFGTQFIGYRDYARELEEKLAEANKRADALAIELEHSERRTHQEYELENPEDDELLDALSLLEIHGTEARNGLDEAEAGLSRLFPYFFHKKEQPATFIDLAQCFNGKEDLGLQLRQEGLKVGVEGTMALIAESQQQIDWSKVGDTGKIETKKWQSLIKAAKPNSKKILATLGYKPAPAPSSSKPEVK